MKMMNILLYEFHIFEPRDEAAYLTVMIFLHLCLLSRSSNNCVKVIIIFITSVQDQKGLFSIGVSLHFC